MRETWVGSPIPNEGFSLVSGRSSIRAELLRQIAFTVFQTAFSQEVSDQAIQESGFPHPKEQGKERKKIVLFFFKVEGHQRWQVLGRLRIVMARAPDDFPITQPRGGRPWVRA